MNKIKFELKSTAYSDIENIADFIARDNKTAAKNMVNEFYETFLLLCEHPESGKKIDGYHDKNVRCFIVKRHYQIFYKKENDSILILRVLTGYQDICELF